LLTGVAETTVAYSAAPALPLHRAAPAYGSRHTCPDHRSHIVHSLNKAVLIDSRSRQEFAPHTCQFRRLRGRHFFAMRTLSAMRSGAALASITSTIDQREPSSSR
jgi:hypothetical protein